MRPDWKKFQLTPENPPDTTTNPGKVTQRLLDMARVARVLWRLTPREGQDPLIERLDVSTAELVVVHLAVTDTPFYLAQGGAPARDQLAQWGHRHVAHCAKNAG